jgi:hypothetical protein
MADSEAKTTESKAVPKGKTTKSKAPAKGKAAKSKAPAKGKTKSRSEKAAKEPKEAPKPKLPPLEAALGWVGLRVDGMGTRTLGRVAGIHVDADDGEPRWVLIRLGPLAGCTAVPYEHVAEGAGRLWAAYDRDWIREAPRFKPNEALTALQELELCAHWGIREDQGRAAEVGDQAADEITAVPAED